MAEADEKIKKAREKVKEKIKSANTGITLASAFSTILVIVGLGRSSPYFVAFAIILMMASIAFAIIDHARILVIANNPEIEPDKE